jgi:hypothetical protein
MKRGMIHPMAMPLCNDGHIGNSPSNTLLVAGTFPPFRAGGAASSSLLVEDKLEGAPCWRGLCAILLGHPFSQALLVSVSGLGGQQGEEKPSPPSSYPSRYTKWASYLLSFRFMRWMPLRSGPRGAGESGKKPVIHPYFFFCFYKWFVVRRAR